MKIHDKFIIELSEIIKGYGNDYRVEEPFHLPCDYKFYEISGVAICEESFNKMKPLNDEINEILDKIRAEIADLADTDAYGDYQKGFNFGLMKSAQIIDKYKESEDKE